MPQPFFEGGVLGATIGHMFYKAKFLLFLAKKLEHFCFFGLINATQIRRQKACLENVWDYVQGFISQKCLQKKGDR